MRVPTLANPDLVIRPAQHQSEIDAANALVFRNYVAQGYWEDDKRNLTDNKWLHSPERHVFVALVQDAVVGTVSLVFDSANGLPSDSFQPTWLNYFRKRGDRLAEVSALAVAKDGPRLKNLPLFLMKYYMQYSFYYSHADRLVKACRPNHAEFYADVLRFEKLGELRYNTYAHVPARFLSLDLWDAHRVLYEHYERGADPCTNLYRFFLVDEHPCVRFPDRRPSRPRGRDWVSYQRQLSPALRTATG